MSDKNKIKFSEKLSHAFNKKWLYSGIQFILLVAILIVGYYCLYVYLEDKNLPEIDITKNKIHTLSDSSKNVLSKIDSEVQILVYGYDDNNSIYELLRQYNKTNNLINYKKLTAEEDLTTITQYNLSEGYYVLIVKTADGEKVIDGSEFTTVDYTIGQQVDITEQVITNSILSLIEKNKPVVYFTEGHKEYTDAELKTVKYFLNNEAFTVNTLNIDLSENGIPDDCTILAIIAPEDDFTDKEVDLIKQYIAKGGNIFFSTNVLSEEKKNRPNIQKILDEYGVTVENGFILEYADNKSPDNFPFVFAPELSSTNKITSDLYTDSAMSLVESARLHFVDDENLHVERDILISSSTESVFINDLNADSLANAALSASTGVSDIAAQIEKTISEDGENKVVSKLIVCSTSSFMTDLYSQYVSTTYPLSYIGCNKDFVINAMSYLGGKDNILTIRKDYAANSYLPTDEQNRIVLTIIFSVPLFIIVAGFIIWNYRNKRK